jgi:hypothetical protein
MSLWETRWMRTIRRYLTYPKVALTVGVFLLAAGAAWAATRSIGTINACYAKRGGALRIAGRCKHGEKPLSWNQTGSAGLNGVAGAKGASGVPGSPGQPGGEGAPGPSDAYLGGKAVATLTGSYVSYGQLSLPPGSYLLEANATFVAKGATTGEMNCLLNGGIGTPYWDTGDVTAETGKRNILAMLAAQTFSTPQTVELVCKLSAGEGVIDQGHLVAIKVGALHGSLPVD